MFEQNFSENEEKSRNWPETVEGWHKLNFYPMKKRKVVPGSICIKFSKSDQPNWFQGLA